MDYASQYLLKKKTVEEYLRTLVAETKPRTLYQPTRYILAGGGKRIRALLVLLACEAVGGTAERALPAGAALELLHNFSLVHDDIMDNADARRGRATIHKKWDTNVAILAGDALLCLAYRALNRTESDHLRSIIDIFTEGVLVVCEGQSFDKEFETRASVSVPEYMMMISKKTGRLISVSAQLGAIIGDGKPEEIEALKQFGELLGRAFQIQDDLLDMTADVKKFGKIPGGDLQEGKKTYLLLEALRRARGADKRLLQKVIDNKGVPRTHIKKYLTIYTETGAIAKADEQVRQDIERAKEQLARLSPSEGRAMLFWFTDWLLNRTY